MALTRPLVWRSILIGLAVLAAPPAPAQWVQFVEQTGTRLSAPQELGVLDVAEKSYAWADFDRDGDVDLAVARKQGWTTPGKRAAVLLMNEGGVLTDRTATHATAATVAGDQGFQTLTNSRDIVAVDVDLDGWADLVTAPTISPGDPKHIGHPRVYHNLGCAGDCNGPEDWLGFRFEDARIPAMLSDTGQSGFNPCFCHVAAGDVTGDGYPELWFLDYDTGTDCAGAGDYNNKLLINQGSHSPGFFNDGTETSFSGGSFPVSAFGASGAVIDMNGDGRRDLLQQEASLVRLAFNNPQDVGSFLITSSPYTGSAYFASNADLNKDGRQDLIISDDGPDRYLINQGNGSDTVPDFLSFVFSFHHTGTGGPAADDSLAGNSIAADLDGDAWQEVLLTDVDVDISGCTRRMHLYRNLGGTGGFVTLQEQTTGSECFNAFPGQSPNCLVAGIPSDRLMGVHDVAVFDINGDQRLDLVVGRCDGTSVFINRPPPGACGSVPDGDLTAGPMLLLDYLGWGDIELTWGDSCHPWDTDYAIYWGELGSGFDDHEVVTCTTYELTSFAFYPPPGNVYFLVVPHNGAYEGSYGVASDGTPRQQGAEACWPMVTYGCH